MADVPIRLTAVLLLGILALSATGCADFDPVASWNPFSRGASDTLPGLTPPAERIKALQKLARKGTDAGEPEREQVAVELGGAIRVEEDPMVRAAIIRTLGEFPCETASRILRAALEDKDPDVRVAACEAWGKRGDQEAVDVLGGILRSDNDIDVRLAATGALGKSKQPSAVQALEPAINDKDPAMQYRAVLSLKQITGKHFGNNVIRWQQYVRGEIPEPPKPVSVADRIRRLF